MWHTTYVSRCIPVDSFTDALHGNAPSQPITRTFPDASLRRNAAHSFISLAPPTGLSSFNQWTIGPIYYAVLALAEAFGKSNTARIVDITQETHHPVYAIYENNALSRVALFNYMTDPSGANDYTATLFVGGQALGLPNGVPAQVQVK